MPKHLGFFYFFHGLIKRCSGEHYIRVITSMKLIKIINTPYTLQLLGVKINKKYITQNVFYITLSRQQWPAGGASRRAAKRNRKRCCQQSLFGMKGGHSCHRVICILLIPLPHPHPHPFLFLSALCMKNSLYVSLFFCRL